MKKTIIQLLALPLLGVLVLGCAYTFKRLPPENPPGIAAGRDPDMDRILKKEATRPGTKIAFMGDSIMQRWDFRPKYWEQYFGNSSVNLSMGGDRIGNAIWRVRNGMLDNTSAELFVILIGTNDIGPEKNPSKFRRRTRPDEIATAISSLAEEIHAYVPHARVLVLGILPRGGKDSPLRDIVIDTNKRLELLATSSGKFYFTDAVGQSLLQTDGSFKSGVTVDNLHLLDEGYRLFGQALQPEIKAILDRKISAVSSN